jgi:DNA-binding MarR family transcriptional regulator
MEDDGLIYRKPEKEDKRVVRIFLTQEGLELKKKIKDVVINFNKKLFKKISKEDFEAFVKINDLIKEQVKEDVAEFQEKNGTL